MLPYDTHISECSLCIVCVSLYVMNGTCCHITEKGRYKGRLMASMITTVPRTSTSINTYLQALATTPMQSPHDSESDATSGESEHPSDPIMHLPTTSFQFTPEDKTVLKRYMDEFEQADKHMRNNILEKVMGELYKLRPGNSTFDKKEAKQARIQTIHICICALTETCARKSKSGSTITVLLLMVGRPGLFGDGQQGMSSTMTKGKTSWGSPRKCPEVPLELRNS
jgi:hypothetical protein